MKIPFFYKTKDDRGISLVELIVVISIMAVMIGFLSWGVSLMFSKDAEYVAKVIDDELSETRMLSMSKAGDFQMILHIDNRDVGDSSIEIQKDSSEYKTVPIKKKSVIKVRYGGNTIPSDDSTPVDVTVVFDKGNGSVKAPMTTDICTITVTSKKLTSQTVMVDLAAASGRHYIRK